MPERRTFHSLLILVILVVLTSLGRRSPYVTIRVLAALRSRTSSGKFILRLRRGATNASANHQISMRGKKRQTRPFPHAVQLPSEGTHPSANQISVLGIVFLWFAVLRRRPTGGAVHPPLVIPTAPLHTKRAIDHIFIFTLFVLYGGYHTPYV